MCFLFFDPRRKIKSRKTRFVARPPLSHLRWRCAPLRGTQRRCAGASRHPSGALRAQRAARAPFYEHEKKAAFLHTSPCILPLVGAAVAMGALRLRRACALLACGATLLYNVRRLVAQQGDAPEAAAACALARQLELALPSPPSETGSDTAADDEVRLFWWHRFEGHRRAVRTPERFTCADGLSCVSDSRTSAFAAAHGVVIWSGPDHRRGECLPPQRPAHTWVLEFSEPPTVDARTEAELYSEAFMRRFEIKVRRA